MSDLEEFNENKLQTRWLETVSKHVPGQASSRSPRSPGAHGILGDAGSQPPRVWRAPIAVHNLAPELGSIKQANKQRSLFQNVNLLKSVKIFSHLNWALMLLGLADRVWISFSCFSRRIRSASRKYVAVMWLYLLVSRALEKQGECRDLSSGFLQAELMLLKCSPNKWIQCSVFKIKKDHK